MKRIEINPVSRIEGHAKVAIFLNEKGEVENAFFQATEFRGYEKLLVNMPMEEVPRVVSTICGICRAIHFIAALKALDQVYGVEATETARIIREILIHTHIIEDHILILLALSLPDFISPENRSIFGVIKKIGEENARNILRRRGYAVKIIEMLGGKHLHPVSAIPGGWTKRVEEDERSKIESYAKEIVQLGNQIVEMTETAIIENSELLEDESLRFELKSLGTVDRRRRMCFYHGNQIVVDEKGREVLRFTGKEYSDVIEERVVKWNYSKIPYLKDLANDIFVVGSLARINVTSKLSTPFASEAIERLFEFVNEHPLSKLPLYHWCRAIETLFAAEKLYELSQEEELTSPDISVEVRDVIGEGVGIVEAPRGTLIHHYITDSRGIVRDANIISPTTMNMNAINETVKRVASLGKINEDTLNKIEISIRFFDPCIACATHSLDGKLPLRFEIYKEGRLIKRL